MHSKRHTALGDTFRMKGTFCLCALLAVLMLDGCQKISSLRGEQRDDSRSTQPLPTTHGDPVEIPNSLSGERTYFQSRSTISLKVSSDLLKAGEQFSLINDSTTSTIIDQKEFSLNLNDESDPDITHWSLFDSSNGTLKLYFLDSAVTKGLAQGENILRLIGNSGSGQSSRTAKTSIYLSDFPLFGFTSSVFPSASQRVDGFQGGFEPVANSIVTSQDQGFMATGFLSISNQ